jgi:serine/threonine-protein phosphatase 2A regulatory subunit B'
MMNEQSYMQSLIIPNIKLIMEMIEKNIFRPLPVLKKVHIIIGILFILK